jgi:hypothetical protein
MRKAGKSTFVVFLTVVLAGGAAIAGPVFDYDDYAAVLPRYVNEQGLVNYAALKADRNKLDAFASALAGLDPSTYESWAEGEKIAFWINAYNGLTLELIVNHYPIDSSFFKSMVLPKNSIMQIPGRWKKITFEVMGEPITLDTIEHKILREKFDEPRIHMALVCAALSCPRLRNEPFVADRLDEQLDDQTRDFLASENRFGIDRDKGVVYLSAIFDWFAEDFVARYGTGDPNGKRSEKTQAVINFVSRYVSDADADYLATGDYGIKHLDYDWTLNEQPDSSLSSN